MLARVLLGIAVRIGIRIRIRIRKSRDTKKGMTVGIGKGELKEILIRMF